MAQTAQQAIAGNGTTPPVVPTLASLDARTAAGVDLARRTMVMIAAAIIILIIVLLVAEVSERNAMDQTNAQAMAIVTAKSLGTQDSRLPGVLAGLRRSASDATWAMPKPDTDDAQAMIEQARKNPTITDSQRADLDKKCIPLPLATVKDRAAILERCASALQVLSVVEGSLGQRMGFMEVLAKSLGEERAAERAFWLQVAQLVLINLLLPILTALLGYIFGTQQAQKSA